jgi:hypothetical protein
MNSIRNLMIIYSLFITYFIKYPQLYPQKLLSPSSHRTPATPVIHPDPLHVPMSIISQRDSLPLILNDPVKPQHEG